MIEIKKEKGFGLVSHFYKRITNNMVDIDKILPLYE